MLVTNPHFILASMFTFQKNTLKPSINQTENNTDISVQLEM